MQKNNVEEFKEVNECDKKESSIGTKIGTAFGVVLSVCLTAIVVALTYKIVGWICML